MPRNLRRARNESLILAGYARRSNPTYRKTNRLMAALRLTLLTLMAVLLLPGSRVAAQDRYIVLASTTSTQSTGFFEYFLPIFRQASGIEVRVVAVGTGQALKLGEKGDADVLLVHDREGELKFIAAGFGLDRREVMYNDFVMVGPQADPAGIKAAGNAVQDLQKIAAAGALFVSRGDDSGTHRMELRLWREAAIDPHAEAKSWYREAGAGMAQVLAMTSELKAYTLSDRASWLTLKNRDGLTLLDEGDPRLFNQYSVMLVNPARHPGVKEADARAYMDFMTSSAGQQAIDAFTIDNHRLFKANAAIHPAPTVIRTEK